MVDDALRAAKEQIDQVTSNSQVDDAVTQGTTNINEVVAIVIKKNDARQTIDGTATTSPFVLALLIFALASFTATSTFAFATSISSCVASGVCCNDSFLVVAVPSIVCLASFFLITIATQKVDAAVTEAKANISTAVTNSNVDTASTNGVNNIGV
jgi:hypothetical protein